MPNGPLREPLPAMGHGPSRREGAQMAGAVWCGTSAAVNSQQERRIQLQGNSPYTTRTQDKQPRASLGSRPHPTRRRGRQKAIGLAAVVANAAWIAGDGPWRLPDGRTQR